MAGGDEARQDRELADGLYLDPVVSTPEVGGERE